MRTYKIDDKRVYLEEYGKILATLNYQDDGHVITVFSIFVDESLRGQGIAKELMEEIVKKRKAENKEILPICSYAKRYLGEDK